MGRQRCILITVPIVLGLLSFFAYHLFNEEPLPILDESRPIAEDRRSPTVVEQEPPPTELVPIDPATISPETEEQDQDAISETWDSIKLIGTITVVDEAGVEHKEEDGRFFMSVFDDSNVREYEITVRKGAWTAEVYRWDEVSVYDLILGEKPAFIDEEDGSSPLPRNGRIHFTAKWPRTAVLHVRDAASGNELDSVELVTVDYYLHDCREHPADFGQAIVNGAASPITLLGHEEVPEGGYVYMGTQKYFARSPGYGWKNVEIDFIRGGEYFLSLERGGAIEVIVSGLDPATNPVLRLRKSDGIDRSKCSEISLQYMQEKNPFLGWGSQLLEVPINGNRSIRLGSISEGSYLVSGELGASYLKPLILGKTEVTVTAGHTPVVTLVLESPPVCDTVPFTGRIICPAAWDNDDFFCAVELIDPPKSTLPTRHNFRSSDLEKLEEDGETTYFWDLGHVETGWYQIEIGEFTCTNVLEVGPAGNTNALIRIPEPASVHLQVKEKNSGSIADVSSIWWWSVRPEKVRAGICNSAWRNDESGLFEFRAPVGNIKVILFEYNKEKYGELLENFIVSVQPGSNEHTLSIERGYGIIVIAREGAEILPWKEGWDVYAELLDRDNPGLKTCRWTEHPEGQKITMGTPGRYRLTFDFQGCKPIEERIVRVHRGEYVRHVIMVERER